MNTKTKISQLIQQDNKIAQNCSFTILEGNKDRNHVQRRQQQRAINNDMIKVALTYGCKDYSYGAVRFTLTDRALRKTPYAKVADSLRGLRVVCQSSDSTQQIITAYWNTKTKQRSR